MLKISDPLIIDGLVKKIINMKYAFKEQQIYEK